MRVEAGDIRVDGRLDDPVWRLATPIVDFTQKEPIEGAPPTDAMEVRFAFDESALYIGARMYTRESRAVQAPLGRRDNAGQTEHIIVSLDTFLDRRTAASFGVTAAGVRLDRFHSGDDEDRFDAGFDPVWEARTAGRRELDRGTVDPLFTAPLQRAAGARVGSQRAAVPADAERGNVLDRGPADGTGLVLPLR